MQPSHKLLLRHASLMIAALSFACSAPLGAETGPGPMRVIVNPGDSAEQSRVATYTRWKVALEQAFRKERVSAAAIVMSSDATADLSATRSRIQDVLVAPAHVIGSALRNGYLPVLSLEKQVQAVLVVSKESPISSLALAGGKRLGLPLQDSIVTYLIRGEVNAANTTIKRHFSSVYESRYQDALLLCLQVRQCDAVAVERSVFDRWVATGESLKVVMESKAVPGLSVAIRDGLRPGAEALSVSLGDSLATGRVTGVKSAMPVASDFEYVATLGYFTPRALPGATVVDAKGVALLMQNGAIYIDTRTEVEFKAGRVPGARLVPYLEKSRKDADFDPTVDQFDLALLPKEKAADLIFACNGAECWKSFKASHAALKAGYSRVHWFRGGFPEWRKSGLKADGGPG